MNIGIDIDDTITETFDYLMPYVAEFFETDIEYLKRNNISYSNLPDEWKKREIDFAKKYYDKVVIGIPTKPHVCEYISKIKMAANFAEVSTDFLIDITAIVSKSVLTSKFSFSSTAVCSPCSQRLLFNIRPVCSSIITTFPSKVDT